MEKAMIFHILGIDETKDEAAIKSAYLKKLKTTNPEDNAEGFKKLREAYEAAVSYARQPEPEKLSGDQEKTDIQLWIDRIDAIYQDITLRWRPQPWKELLSDPICEDLDTSLQAREALLAYLMDHIYLPHEILKQIDDTFQIVSDLDTLTEKFPKDFLNYLVHYITNEEFINYTLFQITDREHMDADGYIRSYFSAKRQADQGNTAAAMEAFRALKAFGVYHPYEDTEILRCRTEVLENKDAQSPDSSSRHDSGPGHDSLLISDSAAALEADARQLLDSCPSDHYVRLYCGLALYQSGCKKEAYELWQQILADNPQHYMAKYYSIRYLMEQKDYHQAKELLLDLLDINGNDQELIDQVHTANEALIAEYREKLADPDADEKQRLDDTMELGWCLFQNDRLDETIALMESFSPDDEHEYSYYSLFSRLLYRAERYQESLPLLQKWLLLIRETPDDGSEENRKRISREFQACHLLSGCCHGLEDHGQAIAYVDEAIGVAKKTGDLADLLAAMQYKAYLLFCHEEYERCIDICDQVAAKDSQYYPAFLQRLEAAYKLNRGQQVVDDYYKAIAIFPGHYKPYMLAAEVFFYHNQFEDAKGVLDRARDNQVPFTANMRLFQVKILRNLAESNEDRREPFQIAEALLEELSNPDIDIEDLSEVEYELGLLSWDDHDYPTALDHLSKAIEQNPKRMQYRLIRGHVYLDRKEYQKALTEYSAARSSYDHSSVLHYNCGLCHEAMGYKVSAMECYERSLNYSRTYRDACEKLADYHRDKYTESNDPEEFKLAISYMDRQIEADPNCHDLVHRGLFYMRNLDLEEAIRDFEEALKFSPDEWVIYNNLGVCYERMGDYDRAIDYFQQALEYLGDRKSLLPYNNLADCYLTLEQYEKALRCYEKNLEQFPDDKNLFKELGFVCRYMKDYKKALSWFEKDPQNKDYYSRIADTQYLQGRTTMALLTYKEGVRKADSKQKSDRYSDLASYYLDQLVDLKKADYYFRKAIAIETDPDKLHELEWQTAAVCFRMGKLDEAKVHAQNALKHFAKTKWKFEEPYLNYKPYRPARLFRHAWIYICLGETETGLRMLKQMTECLRCTGCRYRTCFESYLYLGFYYEAIGEYDTAIDYYNQALAANPLSITAKATLDHLLKTRKMT